MKIAVVGSRKFKDELLMELTMRYEFRTSYDFISGGASGADTMGFIIVGILNNERQNKGIPLINTKIFHPDYDKYGKSACAIRNQQIVDASDKILAFWDGVSKGTKMTIDIAVKANKPIDIFIRS